MISAQAMEFLSAPAARADAGTSESPSLRIPLFQPGSCDARHGRRRSMRPTSLIRKATKAAVLPLGIPARRRRGDVVILLYHRVGIGDREIDIPLRAFERQLMTLKRRHRVLSIDQAFEQGGEGGVVVTFDDGYRDFYDHVLPLL